MIADPYILQVTALSKAFHQKIILNNVSLKVKEAEIRLIIGSSGGGKTTLLKNIIGLLKPDSGEITILGKPFSDDNETQQQEILSQIGVMFQGGALIQSLSALENVKLPLQEKTSLPPEMIQDIAAMKLAAVGLEKSMHLLPSELSGGMRKRVALARAIALDPKILFCDEPSAGLDPMLSAEQDQLFLKLRNQLGMTIVIVTHDVESIRHLADQITMLAAGEVLADGSLSELLAMNHPLIDNFFTRSLNTLQHHHENVLQYLTKDVPWNSPQLKKNA